MWLGGGERMGGEAGEGHTDFDVALSCQPAVGNGILCIRTIRHRAHSHSLLQGQSVIFFQ